MDLRNKSWAIFGLKGSGKSVLLKSILDSSPDHLVYDPMNEHRGYKRYVPDDRRSTSELSDFIAQVVIPRKPTLFVIDEANRHIRPKPTPLPAGVDELNDLARHWNISVGYVARRPVQFHTDIVELAQVIFFFILPGKNDYRYLEDLHAGLGDQVRQLRPFHFVSLTNGQQIKLHSPVDTRGKLP